MQDGPAPVVCHMTDGIYTGEDPEPVARRIMGMGSADGNVLLTNIFITEEYEAPSGHEARDWRGITSRTELDPQDYLYKLRRMSSPIPDSYRELMTESGYQFEPGALMLMPGVNQELVALGFQMASATPVARGR